jgi:hypothetical protein
MTTFKKFLLTPLFKGRKVLLWKRGGRGGWAGDVKSILRLFLIRISRKKGARQCPKTA